MTDEPATANGETCPRRMLDLGREWRDVDVRLMLPDDEFDRLFPDHRNPPHADPKWALLCEAIADMGHALTGLPIDFQIQRTTQANEEFNGPRSALGLLITG